MTFSRGKRRTVMRAPTKELPTGECGTHREGDRRIGVSAILGAGREAVEAPLLALRHSANTSSFPVALAFSARMAWRPGLCGT